MVCSKDKNAEGICKQAVKSWKMEIRLGKSKNGQRLSKSEAWPHAEKFAVTEACMMAG